MNLALVLSGGGIRGVAHLGVIKALEEEGITFSIISGASAGSIVGALYSYGYSPDESLEIIDKTNFFKFLRPALSLNGILKVEKMGEVIQKYLPEDSFEALKIPLVVTAVDLNKGIPAYFEKGELVKPILASCCIPVIFDPVTIGETHYIDGGILDNLPVEPVLSRSDKVIASHCNPIDDNYQLKNVKTLLERTMLMAINGNTKQSKLWCDLVIEPPALSKVGGFETNRVKEIFNVGYDYAKENMASYLNVLKQDPVGQ
ncbi:MAG: patatin-like phospholipase family protein [Bacteroidota bacterium]